jgi:hypothetical protein
MADKWSAMLEELVAYRKRFGTTDVSSRNATYARLGRWIAAQRHKRRRGSLARDRIRRLNAAGMLWSPGDEIWQGMFRQLKEFAKREGHCNIPEHYAPNQKLASWAHNQRYRKRKGELSRDRRQTLESIGFQWSIYRERKSSGKARASAQSRSQPVVAPVPPPPVLPRLSEERLYRLRHGMCIQFNGKGKLPEALARYEKQNNELPPYIPLPRGETTFYVGEEGAARPCKWRGTGALPAQVLEYVNENGCLPRHT